MSILKTIHKVEHFEKGTNFCLIDSFLKAKSLTQMDEIQRKIMKKQAKVFYLVGLLILSFIFCWAPYALLSILGILGLSQVKTKIN